MVYRPRFVWSSSTCYCAAVEPKTSGLELTVWHYCSANSSQAPMPARSTEHAQAVCFGRRTLPLYYSC